MPPLRVRVEESGEDEKSRRGNAIWRRRAVAPAVTESATKLPGIFREPGQNSISAEPFFAFVSVAEAISAASSSPDGG